MPPSIASDLSSAPPSPAPPSPAPSTSPPRTPPAIVKDSILKNTDAGVKKPAQKKKAKKSGSRPNQKAKQALQKMHIFFKAHRDDDECKNMSFSEQQKVLGKMWKASPENPKNGGV